MKTPLVSFGLIDRLPMVAICMFEPLRIPNLSYTEDVLEGSATPKRGEPELSKTLVLYHVPFSICAMWLSGVYVMLQLGPFVVLSPSLSAMARHALLDWIPMFVEEHSLKDSFSERNRLAVTEVVKERKDTRTRRPWCFNQVNRMKETR